MTMYRAQVLGSGCLECSIVILERGLGFRVQGLHEQLWDFVPQVNPNDFGHYLGPYAKGLCG